MVMMMMKMRTNFRFIILNMYIGENSFYTVCVYWKSQPSKIVHDGFVLDAKMHT